jgi:hypothetical protein
MTTETATFLLRFLQRYQASKALSLDMAEFREKGPQIPGLPRV